MCICIGDNLIDTILRVHLAFVEKNCVDPAKLNEAFTGALFACPIYQNYGRQILDAAYRTKRAAEP